MSLAMSNQPGADYCPMTLEDLRTPCLLLDSRKMDRNLERLKGRAAALNVSLRPHLKTAKSVPVARRAMETPKGPATVSTLLEANRFADAGVTDILYAVGIAPGKLDEVIALRTRNIDLTIILDSEEQAVAVAEASRRSGQPLPALIEIDCDGHRSGVKPNDSEKLLRIATTLIAGGAIFRGVMTHAGESYGARTQERLVEAAEAERLAVVDAASHLQAAGMPCTIISVGSTPTAHFARDLTGVTEMRAGVYMFFDLVMAGIGVCSKDDIALSVLTTVIGHQREKRWIIVDAGWMAMSRDRGTAKQAIDYGYGLVCDLSGQIVPDLIVLDANQEHGIIAPRPGSNASIPDLKIGERLRILPNHACATGAQYDRYHVVNGNSEAVETIFPRFGGW